MDKPTICVAVPLEDELITPLLAEGRVIQINGAQVPRSELLSALSNVDGLISPTSVRIDSEFLEATPQLQVISQAAVGYNNVDIASATKHGVAICNTPGVLNAAVADLTMVIIISLARRLFEFEAYSRSGAWGRRETSPPLGHDIKGKTLGVVGFGRIGQEVARRMQNLGMRVIWYDVFNTAPPSAPKAMYRSLDDLMSESDFITIHTNLTTESQHLIGAHELSLMRPDAYIVNTARGPVIDQAALVQVLQSGAIAGAGLDVLEIEPPEPNEPIVSLPNVLTFPHIGTASEETRFAMRELAVRNLLAVMKGATPPAIVNPEALG